MGTPIIYITAYVFISVDYKYCVACEYTRKWESEGEIEKHGIGVSTVCVCIYDFIFY